jgi:hypothetical protein
MSRDFFDPLVDELLSEVAESFFEARRKLDAKIEIFRSYVKRLTQKQRLIQERAAILNFLLLNQSRAEAFYRMLDVDPEPFITEKKFDKETLAALLPFGLRVRTRYVKLTLDAYQRLQQACQDYVYGRRHAGDADAQRSEEVSYKLVIEMLKILNQEINKINCSLSPSCSLQFAKKFHPDTLQKEKITGTGTQSYDAIEKQLQYAPIDLADLDIAEYPLLPNLQGVAHKIERFCKSAYSENVEAVKDLIKDLQGRKQSGKT